MSPTEQLGNYRAVVITGASSGIGKAFLKHAYSHNEALAFYNLSRSFPEIKIRPGGALNLRHIPCDFSDRASLERGCATLVEELERGEPEGRILFINNSGFGTYGPFPEPNLGRNLDMLDVNVRAPVLLAGRLLPLLLRRGGTILNIASTAAFQPTPFMGAYGATKAFLLHWSLALSEELRGTGVEVLAVCPGPTTTNFFSNAGLLRPILPDYAGQAASEVVEAAWRALGRGRSLVVSGWKNKLLTAASALLPKALATRVAARVIAHYRPPEPRSGASHG